jgi:hypothetical protein
VPEPTPNAPSDSTATENLQKSSPPVGESKTDVTQVSATTTATTQSSTDQNSDLVDDLIALAITSSTTTQPNTIPDTTQSSTVDESLPALEEIKEEDGNESEYMSGKFRHVRKPKPMAQRIIPKPDSPGFFYTPPSSTEKTLERKPMPDSSILKNPDMMRSFLAMEELAPQPPKAKKVSPKKSPVHTTPKPTKTVKPTPSIPATPTVAVATPTVAKGPQLHDEKEAIDTFSEKSQMTPVQHLSDAFAKHAKPGIAAGSSNYVSNAETLAKKLDLTQLDQGTDEDKGQLQDSTEAPHGDTYEDIDLGDEKTTQKEEGWSTVVSDKRARREARQEKKQATSLASNVCAWLSPKSYKKATGSSSDSPESLDSEYVPTPPPKAKISRGSPDESEVPTPKSQNKSSRVRRRGNKGKAKTSPPPTPKNQDFR